MGVLCSGILLGAGLGPAYAETRSIDFEAAPYTTGSINGQNGWGGQTPPGIAVNTGIDQGVSSAMAHSGTQSYRESSVFTSGSFGDQVFSPSLTDRAGEVSSAAGGFAGGTLQSRFTATVWFRSATGAPQDSHVVMSPDRGDGARMSWIQVSDNVVDPGDGRSGLSVSFYDYRAPVPDDFVFAVVATSLDRSQWHRIDVEMQFYEGPRNDVVRVSVDGGTPVRGTSWEDYFRNVEHNPTRPVDSLLFRVGGGAEGNAGEGFFFDDVSYASGPCSAATRYVATTGDDAFNDCRDSGSPCLTIQHANDAACPGDTVSVAAGTYNESPHLTKSLTVQSASGRDLTFIALQPGPTYLGALDISGSDVTLDGFTIIGRDGTPSVIASSNVFVDTTANPLLNGVVIKNNRMRVGLIDAASSTGDDGFGVLTTYGTSVNVNSLSVTDNVFEPLNSQATRAFYINPGVDAFTFQRNQITGKFGGRSLTQAKNGVVEDNTVDGQGLGGNGLGTWGYPDAAVWGHTTFRGNVFAGMGTALSIFETNDVIVECNQFSGNSTGVGIFDGFGTANFDPTTIDIHRNSFLDNTVAGVANSATTPGTVAATPNWWGCVTGPNTAGCDTVSANVGFTPFSTSVPACVNCSAAAECDDGLVCTGTETCNLLNMCQAGTSLVCSLGGADPQCNDAVCVEPTGCEVDVRPNGTTCNGGDICQAGACVGPDSMVLRSVRLRRDTSSRTDVGSVVVQALVNDNDTRGTLPTKVRANTTTVEVMDASTNFHTTIALTGCRQAGRFGRTICRSRNMTALVLPVEGPNVFRLRVTRVRLGVSETGGTGPTGPVTVIFRQGNVTRTDDIGTLTACTAARVGQLNCREP